MNPHEESDLHDIHQRLKNMNRRLRKVEIQLAIHRAEHKSLTKYKALLFTTTATTVGAVVAIVVK
jgi:hypothetical protein